MKEAKLAPVSRITTKSDTNADNHNAFDKVGDLPNDSDLVVENNSIDVEFFNEETSMEKIEE